MLFFKRLSLTVGTLLIVFTAAISAAAACPDIVQTALQSAEQNCTAIGRNQACYGNISLSAQPQADIPAFTFTKPGDLVNVDNIETMTLSPLDQQADTWGVAMMKIQANLPDTLPGQNTTFLMFGDVQIQNVVKSSSTTAQVEITATQGINIRERPSISASILSSIKRGDRLTGMGRLEDSSWARVKLADGSIGWVFAQLINDDISSLDVVEADTPVYTPMQAFYFKSGLNDAPCVEAPDSGILIQTPKGAGKVQITADGVQLSLGSTAYLQAQPGGFMTVSVVEGNVTVTAGGVSQGVPAGSQTQIPLDANGIAAGTPQFPQPYDQSKLLPLPISDLPIVITIAPPLSTTEINGAIATAEGLPTPGTWRQTVGAPSGCNISFRNISILMSIATEQDGAVIDMGYNGGSYIQRYYRTASGDFVPDDLPRDYRPQGSVNVRQTEVLHVISPTHMVMDTTDINPATNCQWSTPVTYDFVSG